MALLTSYCNLRSWLAKYNSKKTFKKNIRANYCTIEESINNQINHILETSGLVSLCMRVVLKLGNLSLCHEGSGSNPLGLKLVAEHWHKMHTLVIQQIGKELVYFEHLVAKSIIMPNKI